MGQQADEPRLAQPLGLPAADELVKDNLRAVCKVPELRLPDNQRVRVLHGVTQLVTQHAKLREARVGDGEALGVALLGRGHVVQRAVLPPVLLRAESTSLTFVLFLFCKIFAEICSNPLSTESKWSSGQYCRPFSCE